ncbi:glutathione peroxidase [Actinomadura sp. ATCC 31491]|uniref:Glutathione peroxidase n=1 Tax=Actinomadura luzonensis TaxID=2805427 RepID=A0ABT0FYB2_9ACTN|nr:glutathione peroxidase [Actinomadura luzonensis]MCK2217346.1 glutathione peroxidase [Actinomadura luzonensis]
MSLSDIPLRTLADAPTTLRELTGGRPALIVNVASRCGLTPQYSGLVKLQSQYGPRGLTVIGVPCNQFMGQEPGSAEEIQTFCATTYGVDFPLLAKTDVNGPGRHPLYAGLTDLPDADGQAGDVQWNFEKFLVDGDGRPVARFRPGTEPEDPAVTGAIDKLLA